MTLITTFRRPRLHALALAAAFALTVSVAAAQPAPFDIAAQPLAAALDQLARQAGLQLVYSPALVQGRQAPAVKGTLTARQALAQLLAGSGLESAQQGDAIVIRLAPAGAEPGVGTLAEVRVTADALRDGVTEGSGSYAAPGTSAATGLNLSLRETPQSVTVVTRERMDDQNLNSLGQVLEQTPGVSMTYEGIGGGGYAYGYSRGYEITNYQLDGMSMPHTAWEGSGGAASINTAIYDSVTVVRGATGLLTGAGDPSGSISLTRKRPTDKFQASVAQSLGRWNQHRTLGDVGGPLNAAGSLRGRLIGAYDEGGAWIDRYQSYQSTLYGVLEADLSDRTLLTLALEHGRQTLNNYGSRTGMPFTFVDGSPTPFSISDNSQARWAYSRRKTTTASVALEHRFNQAWRANLSVSRHKRGHHFKWGNAGAGSPELDGTSHIMIQWALPETTVDTLEAKLTGSYLLGGRQHDLVAGFNSSTYELESPVAYRAFVGGQILGWDGSYPEPADWSVYPSVAVKNQQKQVGAYLATRLRATDDLSFIVGARWSNWKYQSRSLPAGTRTEDKASSILTPYAGVVYALTPQLSAYASYTTIFKPQTYKDIDGRLLDPEEGKNLELGLKGAWFGGRLTASAAVFEVHKDNFAVVDWTTTGPTGEYAARAEDGTRARGWELEVAGEPARGWRLQGGYTRTLLRDSSGARLSADFQPKHQFKLFTTWTPAGLHRLTVGGGVVWQSEIYSDWDPAWRQKSYAVANLLLNYRFSDHLSLAVNLNNVFDKRYRTDVMTHTYGAPRNLQATLKYKF